MSKAFTSRSLAAIVDGALVIALAVMFITVGLTYGVSAQSAAAILGISGSLLFAGVAVSLIIACFRGLPRCIHDLRRDLRA